MRVVQICFRLHETYDLADFEASASAEKSIAESGYPATEQRFRENNEKIYQPLLAFLERNTQRYRDFRVSLQITGTWLELAERYDVKLIQRLKKLVKAERVELIGGPYYDSLAFFWDTEELTEQVKLYREKIDQLFGVKGRVFAMPDLFYDDMVGRWAEENGFAGVLMAGEQKMLSWRNANHVYEAAGCEYLRLLVVNEKLSKMIEDGVDGILTEKEVEEDGARKKKKIYALERFVKELDLATLRGGLVNLYLDAQVFARQREKGVIGFFDELVELLNSGRKGDKMVGAAEACVVEEPKIELSVKKTVSRGDLGRWQDSVKEDGAGDRAIVAETGLVLRKERQSEKPKWLEAGGRQKMQDLLYGLRREVLASEDDRLIADFRRMLAVDYVMGLDEAEMARIEGFVSRLKQRIAEVKKRQAVEISRAYTKRRDRGNIERRDARKRESASSEVKVNFVARPRGAGLASEAVHRMAQGNGGVAVEMLDGVNENVVVRRVLGSDEKERPKSRMVTVESEGDGDAGGAERDVVNSEVVDFGGVVEGEVEEAAPVVAEPRKMKRHTIRKIIKKLVIE